MSTILTFCTADIPSDLIAKFIIDSQRAESSFNCWSVVRTPTQSPLDEPTKTTLKSFKTGFKDTPFDTLTNFVRELPKEKQPNCFTPSLFAVLDSRSIKDNTVVLWTFVRTMPDDVEEGEWDPERVVTYWKEFRVNFIHAWHVAAILENKPHLYIDELDVKGNTAHFDEDGVFQVPDAPLKEWDLMEEDSEDESEDDPEEDSDSGPTPVPNSTPNHAPSPKSSSDK